MSSQLGLAQLGAWQLGGLDASGSAFFSLSPTATHSLGTLSVTATFGGTGVASVSNSFSVTGGPATAGAVSNYAKADATHATFEINVTAISSTPIAIFETGTGTTQYISAAAVVPGAPTAGTLSDNGDGTVSYTATPPADNGGATITLYTVTLSTGQTATGGSFPITVAASVGVSTTATSHAQNSAGAGAESSASNSVTPTNATSITINVDAPFIVSDSLDTDEVAQPYTIVSGALVAGTAVTASVRTIPNVTNGRSALLSLTPRADGGFNGLVRWDTGNAEYYADEVNLPPTRYTGATTGTVTKISTLPPGTNVSGTVGYQLYTDNGSAIVTSGSHVTTGIVSITGVTGGKAANVTAVPGSYIIVWDNGAGVYAKDQVIIPSEPAGTIVGTMRAVSVVLTDAFDAPLSNLTGLRVTWWDTAPPSASSAPAYVATGASTDSAGVLSVSAVNTTLSAGATGWMEVTTSNGTTSQSPIAKVAAGPVQLT